MSRLATGRSATAAPANGTCPAVGSGGASVIGHNGRSIYVGTFDTLDEADAAARAKRNALFTANFADRASAT